MRTATLSIPASNGKAFINLSKGEKLTGRYWVDGGDQIPTLMIAEIYSVQVMEERGYTIPAGKVQHSSNARVMPAKMLFISSGSLFSEGGEFYSKLLGEYGQGAHVAAIYNSNTEPTVYQSIVFEIS